MIAQILFFLLFTVSVLLFVRNIKKIIRNVQLGRPVDRNDQPGKRWMTMVKVALGQSKMVTRPVAGIMHIFVYIGFVIINIEVLEIIMDGLLGTHRAFAVIGSFYNVLIGLFEILALLVLVGVIVFLARRNVLQLKRFHMRELTKWPLTDATISSFRLWDIAFKLR